MSNEDELRAILEDFIAQVTELLRELPKGSETASVGPEQLSKRALLELVSHEAIVLEAYKDSRGIWTWGVGVTNASGHRVNRYKDNPQSVQRVIEVFKWLVERKYLPDVLEAFDTELNEHQLAAALSFHYNTGAIKKASWVKSFNRGNLDKARREFMNYSRPSEIIPRRKKERDLFFDGKWTNDGRATIFPVSKPSYKPNYRKGRRIDIREDL